MVYGTLASGFTIEIEKPILVCKSLTQTNRGLILLFTVKRLHRNTIFILLILAGCLLIPAGLRVKANVDSGYPIFAYMPDLLMAEERLYAREGCVVPANVDNCDEKPKCYTLVYLTSEPGHPFRQVGIAADHRSSPTPVYRGPSLDYYRPYVYIPVGEQCFIRYWSVWMG